MICGLSQEGKTSDRASDLSALIEKAESMINESNTRDDDSDQDSDSDSSDCSRPSPVEDIGTYTRCLMDLIPSMERTLSQVLYGKQNQQLPLTVEFQVSGPARIYVQNVHDKFRRANTKLVERLGEANWQRHMTVRRRIKKLGSPPNNLVDKIPPAIEASKSIFQPYSMFHDSGLGVSLPTHSDYAATAASHTSFLSSCADGERGSIRVPPTPREVAAGKPFRCDICGKVVDNIKHRVDWKYGIMIIKRHGSKLIYYRRHVFADLQPYICTFSTCKDELVTFPTRKLWAGHEFSEHRVDRTWQCPECPEILSDDDVWREHLKNEHDIFFSALQLRIAAASAEKKMPRVTGDMECPLCLSIVGPTTRTFATHVGKHMEAIALAVLPRENESDSEAESGSSDESIYAGTGSVTRVLKRGARSNASNESIPPQQIEQTPLSIEASYPHTETYTWRGH